MTVDRSGGAKVSPSRRRRVNPMSVGAWPLLFIGPLMLGVLIFYYFPIIGNLYASFTKTNAFGGNQKFVGLDNYTDLLARPDLPSATVNTLFYTAVVLLAVPVAIVLVWRLFFNGNFGLLNQTVKALGVADPPYWLSTPGLVILAVAFFGIWASIGFNVIILSAGLKSIPKELYEAAQLDGAGAWHQFKNITVPLLTPSIFFLTIMQAIGGFQLFDALFGMLGLNNPAAGASRSLVSLFYQEAFVNNNRGAGAAISIMILLLVGAVTAVQFWAQKKWVHYV